MLYIRVAIKSEDTKETIKQNALKDGFRVYSEDEEKTVYIKNGVNDGLALTEDELNAALKVSTPGSEEPYR